MSPKRQADAVRLNRVASKIAKQPKFKKPVTNRLADDAHQNIISRTLLFGKRRCPSKIVVLLHGLNDSAASCAEGVVDLWAEQLPDALLVVPQSSLRTSWSSDEDPGFTWVSGAVPPNSRVDWRVSPFDARRKFGAESAEFESTMQRFHADVARRCRQFGKWLDSVLATHALTNRDLILAGFSQGSILACILGAKRNVLGVIACGGVPYPGRLRFSELMPRCSSTRFLAVNGTKDTIVQRRDLESMLHAFDCEWHWSKGIGHDFPEEWNQIAADWMQRLIQKTI